MQAAGSEPSRKTRWTTLGVEAVLIVFSVLLALAVDEWRQEAADRRLSERVRGTIHDELARNRANIRTRLPYHAAILRSTESFVRQNVSPDGDHLTLKRNPRNEDLGIQQGLGTAGSLGRTGWDLALDSGALEQMDYETTVALARAYANQQEVGELEVQLVDRLFRLYQAYFRKDGVGGELITFQGSLTDFVLREQELLAAYDRALALTGRR
jgi:hypothetical protein